MDIYEFFKEFIPLTTPFLLALITFLNKRRESKILADQKYKEKYHKELEEKRLEDEKQRDDTITDIKNEVATLGKQMAILEESVNMGDINRTLNKLVDINAVNMEYSQSLSKVVITIGESLRKSENPESENIAKAISEHLQTERELTNKIYKSIY